MDILNIDLDNINLDDTNYNVEDPETIIHIRLLAWCIKFEKRKTLKKELSEELIPIAWHPKGLWNFFMSEKKELEPILPSNAFNVSVVYNMKVLEHFRTENYTWRLKYTSKFYLPNF